MSELTIIAIHQVKPEFVIEYQQAAKKVVAGSRQESGCINYDLRIDINNPNTFIFTETWASQQAIDDHNSTAHFLDFISFLNKKQIERTFYLTKKCN